MHDLKPKTARKTSPSWSDVKAKLAGFDRDGLLGLVQALYGASKENQAFLHARFALGGDVLKPYKVAIDRWLWPDVFKNQDTSVAKAKKAISDYKKAIGQPEGLAELTVFYCETAAGFSADIGYQDDGFFDALVRVFEQSLNVIIALPAEQRPPFWARLDVVRRVSQDFGYGVADDMEHSREHGCSVFVDTDLRPYPDQWAVLTSIQPMAPHDIEPTILRATDGVHPLDVTFIGDENLATPWRREALAARTLAGTLPESLTVTLANLIYFEKAQLPQPLANRLIRLAAFQNPEFYKAQAMRMSVWDKPRVIGNAENYAQHIALPRGCLDAVQELLRDNGIRCDLRDERHSGEAIDVGFVGTLRLDQEAAVAGMLQHDTGVLCAPTAFGKTVTAAAMIARRGVNTLVLVHRTELLKQWQERLQAFLGVGKGVTD